ncbi:tRNA (guanosine(37)-N1)-methyltransferase TrmD [Anderseniella sp. Alg231-50]|uniref:tRNA (guanosine(37)-N1)-methyltransferase TrmD n=1 Tax=Anderseniella sp. Alg231-50 TaxID=1922226 RepID=UPI000D558DA2
MPFLATVLTLYPDMFPGPLGLSMAGRGLEDGIWSLEARDIRRHATDKHASVDDTPAGGGPGMVLKPDVLARAIDAATTAEDTRPRLLMSPRGRPLTQDYVRELSAGSGVMIVCGRFEGVDERVIEARGLTEVSVGDYVLSGGEPAAHVVLDAIVRLLPGIMGNAASGHDESFERGRLEHPQYTRPREWEGLEIPPVLLSGDHAAITRWKQEQSEKLTKARRPDLIRPKD